MKNGIAFLLGIVTMLCSCDTRKTLDEQRYSFCIFQYVNEADSNLIITGNSELPFSNGMGVINGIYNYPKRYRNEPYFGSGRWARNPEKYTFDICELETEEKLLPLHGNYYTYFPYTTLSGEGSMVVVRNGSWEQVCDTNPLDLPIIGDANSLYKEIRVFEIRSMERLTKKTRTEMTIDDIEQAVNKVIDEGKLDKYSIKVSAISVSEE